MVVVIRKMIIPKIILIKNVSPNLIMVNMVTTKGMVTTEDMMVTIVTKDMDVVMIKEKIILEITVGMMTRTTIVTSVVSMDTLIVRSNFIIHSANALVKKGMMVTMIMITIMMRNQVGHAVISLPAKDSVIHATMILRASVHVNLVDISTAVGGLAPAVSTILPVIVLANLAVINIYANNRASLVVIIRFATDLASLATIIRPAANRASKFVPTTSKFLPATPKFVPATSKFVPATPKFVPATPKKVLSILKRLY